MDDLAELKRMRSDAPEPSARALADAMTMLTEAAATESQAGSSRRPAASRPARRPLVRRRRLVISLAVAAAVIVPVVVGGIPLPGRDPVTPQSASAADVLRRAANAAVITEPKPDQWIYVHYRTDDLSSGSSEEAAGSWIQPQDYRIWTSADGSTQLQARRDLPPVALPGRKLPPNGLATQATTQGAWEWEKTGPCKKQVSLEAPTYAYLASLPTDPARLRAYLLAHMPESQRQGSQEEQLLSIAWSLITDPVVPADLRIALFRIMEPFAEFTVDPDALDGLGREGIGLRSKDEEGKNVLIFDRSTYAYLGHTSIMTREDKEYDIPAGTVTSDTVVSTSVVDEPPAGANVTQVPC